MTKSGKVIPIRRDTISKDDYAHRMWVNGIALCWIMLICGSATWTFHVLEPRCI